jgi:putative membrane protein
MIALACLGMSACETSYGEKSKTETQSAMSPAALNDLEIAHVAYTADNIDIAYANIALTRSSSEEVRAFAQTMIRDHTAVNELALGLLDKLGAQAQDNFLSQKLNSDSIAIKAKLNSLSGIEFDRYYAANELGYHIAVNDLVENSFIPNIENEEVRDLFKAGLEIFQGHQQHAQMMVEKLGN